MRKYIFIYKSELISSLQYIFNILTGFLSYIVLMFVFLNLWEYMYSDPDQVIQGYAMVDMIWYISITELLWKILGGRKFCRKICDDVKSGNITYNINKPYSYIGYLVSERLGGATIPAILYTTLAMILGFIFLGQFPNLSVISIIAVIVTMILAIIINILFIIFIGLISFFIEDANPFYWLYSKFLLIIGTIFPIEIFPTMIQGILKYSPIYAITYGPARLFVKFSYDQFFSIVISQIIYICIVGTLCQTLYKKGVKKLNVNGG